MFWVVPPSAVDGILNGLDPSARSIPVPNSIENLVEKKTAAKLSFQDRQGLQVRSDIYVCL